ncbi:hypothetical protein ACWF99_21040 [Nocardia sp. NPDC055002]
MRPITPEVLKQLKIADSLARIADAERNLVPLEPGWDHLTLNNRTIKNIAIYIESLCSTGIEVATERELIARKPGHGVRPVAFWGMKEQILYDALTTAALRTLPKMDRSAEKYIEFATAPVSYSREIQENKNSADTDRLLFSILNSQVKYVVKSDLTSFYQFIDHALLADELIAQGANFEVVSHLVDLLSEVTGRPSGLPQLYHASDRLSEVYADLVERSLLRQGFAVWRFNDDFRIACKDFAESIAAIEALDSAARSVGLAMNELKTFTYHFSNYVLATLGLDVLPENGTISAEEVEAVAGDYTDNFAEKPDSALALIRSANISGKDGIDLRTADREAVRKMRRALHALAGDNNVGAFESIRLLIGFVPSLTPDLIKYLITAGVGEHQGQAGEILDSVVESVSLNTWQRVWVIEAYRSLELLSVAGPKLDSRLAWVQNCFFTGKEPLRAVAFRALASASHVSIIQAVTEATEAPEAVRSFYFASVRDRVPSDPTPSEENSVSALRATDAITKALLA